MNRNMIDINSWEILSDGITDEIGIVSQVLVLNFRSINEGEIIQKQYPVSAQSEHFVAADNFVLQRESWALSGDDTSVYLNNYEILEMLEKTL